jgi:hypothetical protein
MVKAEVAATTGIGRSGERDRRDGGDCEGGESEREFGHWAFLSCFSVS